MNANIMNTQIYHLIKYDLNSYSRSQKATFMFILNLTYVLMDNFLSLYLHNMPVNINLFLIIAITKNISAFLY